MPFGLCPASRAKHLGAEPFEQTGTPDTEGVVQFELWVGDRTSSRPIAPQKNPPLRGAPLKEEEYVGIIWISLLGGPDISNRLSAENASKMAKKYE